MKPVNAPARALLLLMPWVLTACGSSSPRDDAPLACTTSTGSGQVVIGSGLPGDPAAPEPASGYRPGLGPVRSSGAMVVTANPLASKAGCEVLQAGGNALDAAVAVQMVLGLVEPQSSGIGGGAFLLYRDAARGEIVAWDGRESAPAAATEDDLRHISASDPRAPLPSVRASGRSIGTPGAVRMLEAAHRAHGSRPWAELFAPAIALAEGGFAISARMAAALDAAKDGLRHNHAAAALYLDARGEPLPLGTHFVNPAYAQTLGRIARGGADAFYRGALAERLVQEIGRTQSDFDASPFTPGKVTRQDLLDYQPVRRDALCISYRARWLVCGMPPPSSGGMAVAQALGILENFDLAQYPPEDLDGEGGRPAVMGVHLVSEALRLAYADRDRYVADADFVPLPEGMLDKDYLKSRAALVSPGRSMGRAQPGDFGLPAQASVPVPEAGTTHISIVDAQGNALSMTTTVESSLGAWRVVDGFVLNNQLTDFSPIPQTAQGPVANRVQPGKRPRSSMAPTLVFDLAADDAGPGRMRLKMVTGSPGGSAIIQYVTKTLVGVLDWGLDAQQATSLVNFGAANSPTTSIGGEHPNIRAGNDGAADPLVQGLRALGHEVSLRAQTSGTGTIVRVPQGGSSLLEGGADPRREGLVLGVDE